jgi:ABC-type Na+ efflux pump permease subunit
MAAEKMTNMHEYVVKIPRTDIEVDTINQNNANTSDSVDEEEKDNSSLIGMLLWIILFLLIALYMIYYQGLHLW